MRDFDVFFAELAAGIIKNAVHFAIPDNGEIFDDDLKGLVGRQVRLPFQAITVEYFVDDQKSQHCEAAPTYSPRRLVLAFETEKNEVRDIQNQMGCAGTVDIFANFPDDRFTQFIVLNEIDGVWVPCPMSWIMPITWDYSPGGTVQLVTEPLVKFESKQYFSGTPIPVLPGLFNLMCEMRGFDQAFRESLHDIGGEVRAVLELCEALACSNVKIDTIQHENKKANAKRAKNGKIPIYATKTLSIVVPATAQRTASQQGDRNSPRQHLRRGHVRRLQDDRQIWVNSCAVGSSGLGRIDKSYNVFSA